MEVNSKNYVELALRTESMDTDAIRKRLDDPRVLRLLHAAMGLSTEANEVVDMLKKHIFYGKPLDEVNAKEEVGDTLWYAAVASDILGTAFEEIMSLNIEKLKKRYPEKFTEEAAMNRDVVNEMKHFSE